MGGLVFTSTHFCFANSKFVVPHKTILLDDSQIQKVADELQWRRLLQFSDSGTGESYASKEFFLAGENGKHNPKLELVATLEGFRAAIPKEAEARDAHARCRFPARFQFLSQFFPELRKLPSIHCPRLARYLGVLVPEQVDLVFASAYVSSPASMYGHTLLRLKRKGKTEGNELLDYIVAFGADTQGASGLSYVFRGLSGGFTGEFTTVPYYIKIREYLHMESRDLWSYPIVLTKEERKLLVQHLWELRLVKFPYYFLGANCSFFLIRFLEAIRPDWNFSNELPDWVIPIDTIREMQRVGALQQGSVRASRLTRLQFMRSQLNSEESGLAYDLVHSKNIEPVNESIAARTEASQARIRDTAYEYFRYLNPLGSERTKGGERNPHLITREQELLQARSKITKRPLRVEEHIRKAAPESAHLSNRAGVEFGVERDREGARENKVVRLAWRPALHDLLGNWRGLDPYAEQEVLHLRAQIDADADRVYLERLNFIKVRSLNPLDSWLTRVSWRMVFGLDRAEDKAGDCTDWHCVIGRLEGGAGVSLNLHQRSRSFAFALATVRAHGGAPLERNFRLGAALETGLRFFITHSLGVLLEWQWQEYFWGDQQDFSRYRGEIALRPKENIELRFNAQLVHDIHVWHLGAFFYY